jgi:adenine-specific DNA-methyltransferase
VCLRWKARDTTVADELDVLLEKVEDSALRAELRAAVDKVRSKRNFGLVFESHLPESVRLPEYPVRRGTSVVRRTDKSVGPMKVVNVRRGHATVMTTEGNREVVPVGDLVVVAEFGEPVYPGLARVGSIQRGGDKPAHVVINAENHHALEMLQFTHFGKVDCIYIDPPYNTGARDWKYDNDYVDGDDAYRHSKWLAFMERRLLLARQLLNPEDSILVVAIDEKEYLRLGLLLGQLFPEGDVQMVTVVTNRAGSPRAGRFSRVEEYLFFVFLGSSAVVRSGTTMLRDQPSSPTMPNVWFSAIRVGTGSALRDARPALFYPVHLEVDSGRLHSIGRPLPKGAVRHEYTPPEGTTVMWPLSTEGREQTWRFSDERMREYFAVGWARLGRRDPISGARPVTYLRPETRKNIDSGTFVIKGRSDEGAVVLELAEGASKATAPAAVWNVSSHYARDYGSRLNAAVIPGRSFPYPKSLYAVEDALRFCVGSKPRAVVLDFFAGSGTTAHAVTRLNRQDGGQRQAIIVTNNEVSAEEATSLTERGCRDGDLEWEAMGIFEQITRPRITAAVTGVTPDGAPIRGDYKFADEFPMADGFDENVEFVKLTYLDPVDVELDRAFASVAPMLWLRAGGQGSMVAERTDTGGNLMPFAVADGYGVLFDPDHWRDFIAALPDGARTAFVVTDSAAVFAGIAENLPGDLVVVRLYENYLTTFAINQGRPS